MVELREESVKHFLCDDGSYIAATYSSPVHYLDDGEWKEFDNSLEIGTTTYGTDSTAMYTTAASATPVSFPQRFANGQKISMSNGGYTVSFGVADASNTSASAVAEVVAPSALPSASVSEAMNTELQDMSVAEPAHISSNTRLSTQMTAAKQAEIENERIKAYNENAMAVENQSGAILYEDIFSGADLEYIVSSNMVKENIVVSAPQTAYTYTFNMNLGGLEPVELENGTILLTQDGTEDTQVFCIQAPYMYDASDAESLAITMTLTPNGNDHTLTLTADPAWINSSERAFPVVIDPTIYHVAIKDEEFQDAYVMDGVYDDNNRLDSELRVGRNLTNLGRAYVMLQLSPMIPAKCVVTGATLYLHKKTYYQAPLQDDISIKVYDCYGIPTWISSTITWNNQPFSKADNGYENANITLLDSVSATASKTTYSFDVTPVVQRMLHNDVARNGLLIVSSDETSKTHIRFHSSRASDSSNQPMIVYSYYEAYATPETWNPSAGANSTEIAVGARPNWTVTSNDSWLTISDKTENGFTLNAAANPNQAARTGSVTVFQGNDTVETIVVNQFGLSLGLNGISENFAVKSVGIEKAFEVVADDNDNWSISCSQNWLRVSQQNGTGRTEVTLTVDPNVNETEAFNNQSRTANVTIQSGDETKIIYVTQLDPISDYFNNIDENGVASQKPSTEYNNPLATWAMELSYKAYNPYDDSSNLQQLLPGAFMNGETGTAWESLEQSGFSDVKIFNYDVDNAQSDNVSIIGHTVGHRNITIPNNIRNNTTNNITNNVGGSNYVSTNTRYGTHSNDVCTRTFFGLVGSDRSFLSEPVLTSDDGSDNASGRPLVVLTVRGTVTVSEWILNASEILDDVPGGFATGKDIVMSTLYGRNIDKEACPYSANHDTENDTGCSYCVGYLEAYGLNDPNNPPIILITGHSLGAAVANLTAAHLSSCNEDNCPCGNEENPRNMEYDIYAYTFATPNTINPNRTTAVSDASVNYGAISYYSASDKEGKGCTNIFNILNSNDTVTFVPDYWLKCPTTTVWSRHGNDLRFTMPLKVDWLSCLDESKLGLGGHAMPTYLEWLQGLSARVSDKEEVEINDDEITIAHLNKLTTPNAAVGLLPIFMKFKCPIDVTVKNSSGNDIAFVTTRTDEFVIIPDGLTKMEFDTGGIVEQSAGTNSTGTVATDESGIVAWTTDDGAKCIMLPYGYGEVTAEIEAYDNGEMDVSVETAGLGVPINRTVRNDITIAENDMFTLTIPADISSATPTVADSTGTSITNISPLLYSVSVVNPEVNYGTLTEIVVETATNVSKIQFKLSGTSTTITIAQDSPLIESLETVNGKLVWTIKRKFTTGTLTYDVGTKVGNTWTYNERIFTIVVK